MSTVNRYCIECHTESHLANGGLSAELSSAGLSAADPMSGRSTGRGSAATGSTSSGSTSPASANTDAAGAGLATTGEGSNVVEFHSRADRAEKRSSWLLGSEAGMATAEYAIATLAAVGFAGLLVFILRSDEVRGFLLTLIRTALALP
jgi:hypothetical protein